MDGICYADDIYLDTTPSPFALHTTSFPETTSYTDAGVAPSDGQIVVTATETEQGQSSGTIIDIPVTDRAIPSSGISTDTPLSSLASTVPDTTDEAHEDDEHVSDDNEAFSASPFNNICTADGSTRGDDDAPAVPGSNADDAYPPSASTASALPEPTNDELGPDTDPSAAAPPDPAATGGGNSPVVEHNDNTRTSPTSLTSPTVSAARGTSSQGTAKAANKWSSGGGQSSDSPGGDDVRLASLDAAGDTTEEVSIWPLSCFVSFFISCTFVPIEGLFLMVGSLVSPPLPADARGKSVTAVAQDVTETFRLCSATEYT